MRRILSLGSRRFTLERGGIAEARRYWSHEDALVELRRLTTEPASRRELRRLVDEFRPGGAAHRLSDEALLREVAALLESRRVSLRERLPDRGALGDRSRPVDCLRSVVLPLVC